MAKVSRLSRPMPPPSKSARRGQLFHLHRPPASRLAFMAAPRAIETPMILSPGDALDGRGDAGGKPAAGERHQHGCRIGHLLHDLQPERALPGDDVGMVEGRQHDHPLSATSRSTSCCASSWLLPTMRTSAPSAADRVDLVLGHQPRHADHRAHALELRRMGKRPAVIAGRGGDDAARASRPATATATAFDAPRSLKLPVVWRCSSLR